MDEAGIVGLLAFAGLLTAAIYTLIRGKRGDPLFPVLAACLTMMTVHSLTEVVWSIRQYVLIVYLLLGAMAVECAPEKQVSRLWAGLSAGLAGALLLLFTVLQTDNLIVRKRYLALGEDSYTGDFLKELTRLEKMDVYDDPALKTTLMTNALQSGDTVTAKRCAHELIDMGDYEACRYAACYYYISMGNVSGFFSAMHTGLLQEASNPDAWNVTFEAYRTAVYQFGQTYMEEFVGRAAAEADFLDSFNAGRMEPIVMDEGNQKFIAAVRSLLGSGLTDAEIYEVLSVHIP